MREAVLMQEGKTDREPRYAVEGTTALSAEENPELPAKDSPKLQTNAAARGELDILVFATERAKRREKAPVEMDRVSGKTGTFSIAYVFFVTAVCVVMVIACVQYLRLKGTVTTQRKQIAEKETRLTKLRSENDALYERLVNAMDLEEIREIAIGRLGMKYADESQVERYSTDGEGYVRQYRDVPEA